MKRLKLENNLSNKIKQNIRLYFNTEITPFQNVQSTVNVQTNMQMKEEMHASQSKFSNSLFSMRYASLQEMEAATPFFLVLHGMVWTILASQETRMKISFTTKARL